MAWETAVDVIDTMQRKLKDLQKSDHEPSA